MAPFGADSWRLEELTVNYRTPAQIASAADAMAVAHGLNVTKSRSVREGENAITVHETDNVVATILGVLGVERVTAPLATAVVIAGDAVIDTLYSSVAERFGEEAGRGASGLSRSIAVMTPQESKGLEFDIVLVAEPARILRESDRGAAALYVSMTRPTQRLHIVTTEELPSGILNPPIG
jgi:hypothetical protein